MRPAIFLDRDGTINVEVNYLSDPAGFRLLPGMAAAIRRLNEAGWPVLVVTNQSGVGRGYFSMQTVRAIHEQIAADLDAHSARIDGIYVCPHHPDEGCGCRKPGVDLFEQAAHEHDLDLRRSVVIGDKFSDLMAGQRLGCATILVLTGHGADEWAHKHPFVPDAVVPDLSAAVDWWLGQREDVKREDVASQHQN